MPAEIGRIEKELKKLWADGEGALTRASLINLAVYSEKKGSAAENTRLMSQVTESHACRAIVIEADTHAADNQAQAWISAHCHVSRAGSRQICSEQISFQLSGPCAKLLTSIVFSHLDSDLPFFLWWQAELRPPLDPELWTWVDHLIYDSHAHETVSRQELLDPIRNRVSGCVKCPHLVRSRTQTVFGVGNPDADLMFVGEAPGADEDAQGEPFVGRAGQLLTRIIETMGFSRRDVYIANVLKCRPDMPAGAYGNRAPTPVEMQTCLPYLREQIEVIQPKVLVALGASAVEGLLGTRGTMRELRGRWHSFNETPLMITYHPAYLLRNQSPSEKRKVWEDMLQVLEKLGSDITEKQRRYFQ